MSEVDLRKSLASNETQLKLEHPNELRLAKAICRMPEVLVKMQEDLLPHSLCEYLYELSSAFTDFYESCYCVEKDKATDAIVKINMERVMLCDATAKVFERGFDILGLQRVSRM